MKNLQCHRLVGRLIVETCFNMITTDCNSLEGCCIVLRLNCKLAHEKNAAFIREELSSVIQYRIMQKH